MQLDERVDRVVLVGGEQAGQAGGPGVHGRSAERVGGEVQAGERLDRGGAVDVGRRALGAYQTDYLRAGLTVAPGGKAMSEGHLFAGAKQVDLIESL